MRKSEYPKNVNTIGGMIRKARIDLGFTLAQVADRIKTAPNKKMAESFLARIEADQKRPSYEVAKQLAKELNRDFPKLNKAIVIEKISAAAAPSHSTVHIEGQKVIINLQKKKIRTT